MHIVVLAFLLYCVDYFPSSYLYGTSIMLFNCTLIRSPSVRVLPTNSVLFKC